MELFTDHELESLQKEVEHYGLENLVEKYAQKHCFVVVTQSHIYPLIKYASFSQELAEEALQKFQARGYGVSLYRPTLGEINKQYLTENRSLDSIEKFEIYGLLEDDIYQRFA